MKDWNLVITPYPHGWHPALRALRGVAEAAPSGHYNVLLAKVDDPVGLLDSLERRAESEPVLIDAISRIAPAVAGFDYETDDGFEQGALRVLDPLLARLAGKSFQVRVKRRGVGLAATGSEEEARLGKAILQQLAEAGAPGRIDFADPDYILAIDAVDGRAGLGLWSREDLRGHRFLRPD